jgi:hypothetical protein
VSAPSLLLNNFLLTPNPNNNLICPSLCKAVCSCGHESLKDSLYEDIVIGEFDLTPTIIDTRMTG